jgi:signal transduction histidine kinase
LGLPIALAIVQAHGGSITVDTAVGQGSTFALRVPTSGPLDREDQ